MPRSAPRRGAHHLVRCAVRFSNEPVQRPGRGRVARTDARKRITASFAISRSPAGESETGPAIRLDCRPKPFRGSLAAACILPQPASTMNSHPREDRLHDYVADLLCREERAEVEHHLVRCEACQAVVKRLRDRVRDAAS